MCIMRLFLAVNPSIAQGLIQSFGIADRFLARTLFEDAQPDTVRVGVVFLQPTAKFRRRLEPQYFKAPRFNCDSLTYCLGQSQAAPNCSDN
jgi:hypothetical protein